VFDSSRALSPRWQALMFNILSGSRALEKAQAEAAAKGLPDPAQQQGGGGRGGRGGGAPQGGAQQ